MGSGFGDETDLGFWVCVFIEIGVTVGAWVKREGKLCVCMLFIFKSAYAHLR